MALRGQGSLQQLLGKPISGAKKRKPEKKEPDAPEKRQRIPGTAGTAARQTGGERPPPVPRRARLKPGPTALPTANDRDAENANQPQDQRQHPRAPRELLTLPPTLPPDGNGWFRIEAAVVGLRFRRSSSGAAAAAAETVTAPLMVNSADPGGGDGSGAAGAVPSLTDADCQSTLGCGPRYRLAPEPTNPKDPNAVQVLLCAQPARAVICAGEHCSGSGSSGTAAAEPAEDLLVGYLPAPVVAHLGPALRAGQLETQVQVCWADREGAGSVPLVLYARAARCSTDGGAPYPNAADASSTGAEANTTSATGAHLAGGCDANSTKSISNSEKPTDTWVISGAQVATSEAAQRTLAGAESGSDEKKAPGSGGVTGGSSRVGNDGACTGVATPLGCEAHVGVGPVEAALAAAAAAAAAWRVSRPPQTAAGEVLRSNFAMMAEDVRRYDGHLLEDSELRLLAALLDLPAPVQCLFLRLLLRRGPWFALSGITYPEVGDVGAAAEALLAAGLAQRPQPEDWPQVLELLPVAEVRALAAGVHCPQQNQSTRTNPHARSQPPPQPSSKSSILAYTRKLDDSGGLSGCGCGSAAGTAAAAGAAAAVSSAGPGGVAASATSNLAHSRSGTTREAAHNSNGGSSGGRGRRASGVGGGGAAGSRRRSSGGGGGCDGSAEAAAGRGGSGVGGGGGGKAAVIEALRRRGGDCAEISRRLEARLGPCIRLANPSLVLVERMQRLYFLTEGPAADLGRFLATERGVIRYPPYTIRRTTSAFSSRQQLLQYEEALRQAASLESSLEAGDDDGAAAALSPALSAVRAGAHRLIRWRGDATIPVRAVPGPWPWEADVATSAAAAAAADTAEATAAPQALAEAALTKGGSAGVVSESKCGEGEGGDGLRIPPLLGRSEGFPAAAMGGQATETMAAAGSTTGRAEAREAWDGSDGAGRRAADADGKRLARCGGRNCGGSDPRVSHDGGREARAAAMCARVGGEHESVDLTLSSDGDGEGRADAEKDRGAAPPAQPTVARLQRQDSEVTALAVAGTAAGCRTELAAGAVPRQRAASAGALQIGIPRSTGPADLGDEMNGWDDDGRPMGQCRPNVLSGAVAVAAAAGLIPPVSGVEEVEADGGFDVEEAEAGGGGGGEDDVTYGDEDDIVYAGTDCWDAFAGGESFRGGGGPEGNASGPDDGGRHAEAAHPQAHQQQLEQPQPQTQPPEQFLARFCAAWVHASMATVGVSLLERQRRYGEAVALLRQLLAGRCCPGRRGEWWMRMSVDLQHLGREEEALQVAEAALADPWVRHGDRLGLKRRVLRLGKPPRRWRRPAWAAAALVEPREVVVSATLLRGTTGLKSRFLAPTTRASTVTVAAAATVDAATTALVASPSPGPSGGAGAGPGASVVSVEELALLHYSSAAGGGWRGVHSEGGAWVTLWALLFWDVLFMDVAEVFRSPFQTAPLDLDTDAFLPARREAMDARLQVIASGGAPELLKSVWRQREGTWCRGVNWERLPLGELQDIARCVGGLGLSVVCRLLCEDAGGWRGGMPDLLLWRPDRGDAMVSEVKGPRDRLSDQQRAWLAALAGAGVRAEVLRVVEAPAVPAANPARPASVAAAATYEGAEGRDASAGGGGGDIRGGSALMTLVAIGSRRAGAALSSRRGRKAAAVPAAGGAGIRGGGAAGGSGRGSGIGATGATCVRSAADEVLVISDDEDCDRE